MNKAPESMYNPRAAGGLGGPQTLSLLGLCNRPYPHFLNWVDPPPAITIDAIFPTFPGFPDFSSVQCDMKYTFISSQSLFSHLRVFLCRVYALAIMNLFISPEWHLWIKVFFNIFFIGGGGGGCPPPPRWPTLDPPLRTVDQNKGRISKLI